MLRSISALLLVLVTALAFTACGDDDSSDSGSKSDSGSATTTESTGTTDTTATDTTSSDDASGDAQVLELKNVGNELKFDKTELTAKAGKVTLRLTNDSSIPHNIALDNGGDKTEGDLVTGGDTSEITVDLKAGTYEYFCTPHEGAGMKGTLTVS